MTPALHRVGWFDRFSITTVRNPVGIKQRGGSDQARQNQRLLIESPDSYLYDPADPTPSVAGRDVQFAGPFDQRPIERRPDVLVFSTPPLGRDTDLIGPLSARLWAASTAPDMDWVVELIDVS